MKVAIQQELDKITRLLANNPDGLSIKQISENLDFCISDKTLQRRLRVLVDQGCLMLTGQRRAALYLPCHEVLRTEEGTSKDSKLAIFDQNTKAKLEFLDRPPYLRSKVSYNPEFLESYVPNESCYVPKDLRQQLFRQGRRFDSQLVAGTYAKQICQRLLIDLSYNSSRLEGNTYSELDTRKLLEEGIAAQGKVNEEALMITNHKEAILFLIENAQDIKLNSFTIRNLHHLLSQDLLANPLASGNVRTTEVDIGQSTYKPLSNAHLLKEFLELLLLKAQRIIDPFEQSFFLLVHLSYLQAFEDVNKRTSRLSCNIPFIQKNLCPLSFTDVPRDDYTAALLCIYELNDIEPMRALYSWAYLRSCEQYASVKNSIGEIDVFRVLHRKQRKEIMGQVIRQGLHGPNASALIESYCREAGIEALDKFTAMTLTDLSVLHVGAIVGLGITEAELVTWLANEPNHQ